MPQYFKGDDLELKFYNSAAPIHDVIVVQKAAMFNGAYEAGPLGDLIYEDARAPLANAIRQDIFRANFKDVFDAFIVAGTFESYLDVFRKIFGDDVVVVFTVPAAGKLQIDITAAGLEHSDMLIHQIESSAFVDYEVIDRDGDNIAFATVKGFQTQYELEQMLFEMVPAGVYTEITLTLG